MKEILTTSKTIASVGVSSNPEKVSYEIGRYLQAHGYRLIPVNPTAANILGEKAYPDLDSVTEKVDVVQVFRRPEDVPPVVEAAIRRAFKRS